MEATAIRVKTFAGVRALERVRPLYVVGSLIVVEWLVVLGIGLAVRHNGWLWYQGGDQVWFYTTSWQLLHGHLPATAAGYGWSILLLPISLAGGPNLLHALPAIVLLDLLVLLPAAMLALYGIGERLGGRIAGYWVLVVWIVTPLVGILYTNTGYHQKFSEITLPQALGLTSMSDFPSMVMLAISAYFAIRMVQGGGWTDCALAGLFGGFGIGIKPASALYLGGLVLALAAVRNRRTTAYVAGGLALPLLALLLWKARGLGHVPILQSQAHARIAGGTLGVGLHTGKYLHLNWSHFTENVDLLRQHFWSGRLLVFFVIAGIVALFRRSRPAALLFGGWFLAFAFVKGMDPSATIQDGSLLRLMIASIPAWVLMLAALPLLVPGVAGRIRTPSPPREWGTPRLRLTAVAAAVVLFAVVPAAFAAATHPVIKATGSTYGNTPSLYNEEAGPIPVERSLDLQVNARGLRVALSWKAQPPTNAVFGYEIVRTPIAEANAFYSFGQSRTFFTRDTSYVDNVSRIERDDFYYRVLEAAAWTGDPSQGDGYIASEPVTVKLLPPGVKSPASCGVVADTDHDWEVIVDDATSRAGAVTGLARAPVFIPGAQGTVEAESCTHYEAVFKFGTQSDAQTFANELIAKGFAQRWNFTPRVEKS